MRFVDVPEDCISVKLPICPECNDTKFVSTPPQTITLSANARNYKTECSKCKIYWKTYGVNHAKT